MKAPFSVVLLGLFVMPCFAQEKPEMPKPNRRVFAGTSSSANPRSTYILGGCKVEAAQAGEIIAGLGKTPPFDLYIICNESDWNYALRKTGQPRTTVAFTDPDTNRIWLGPRALENPLRLRNTIEHELAHLRCHCPLGEPNH